MPDTFRFAVSPFTTLHLSFEEDVDLYSSLGVGTIELVERKLSPDVGRAREQLAYMHERGLSVGSVVPRVHALLPDTLNPALLIPRERAMRFRESVELFAESGIAPGVPFVTITGRAPAYDYAAAAKTARDLYPELARCCAEHGFRLAFEPLSPVLMNTDTTICTLGGAMELVEAVGHEAFGLTFDVWHVWNESGLIPRIEAAGDRIFIVHHSDWPRGEPRDFGDRLLPGDGTIDFPAILGALDRAGYRGPHVLEIFSADHLPDSLWRQDPADVIARGRDALQQAWLKRARRAD